MEKGFSFSGLRMFVQVVFLYYLRLAARLQLLKNRRAKIIGITGSAGKTSLKQALGVMLRDSFEVKVCKHGNSETGIPLDILGLKVADYSMRDWGRLAVLALWKLATNWERFEILVVEMAVDSPFPPKNMEYLLTIVRPDVGVFLNVTTVHGEMFDKLLEGKVFKDDRVRERRLLELIAREKGKVIESLPEDGVAVLNVDEPLVSEFAEKTEARVVGFGESQNALVRVRKIEVDLKKGFGLELEVEGNRYEVRFKDEILGLQYGMTLAAAVGVVYGLGMGLERAIEALEGELELPPGRMNLLRGVRGSWIIDSSYNASKLAMLEAIRTCEKLKASRKIAVLGDMREVGESAQVAHREVIGEAEKVFDRVVVVGGEFGKVVEGSTPGDAPKLENTKKSATPGVTDTRHSELVSESGRKRGECKLVHFENALGVAELVKKWLKKDTLVLVKGSQNTIFLEVVVEELLADPEDTEKLCRRGEYWERVRGEWFKTCKQEQLASDG